MQARSHGSVPISSVAAAWVLMVSAMMEARSWTLLSFSWSISPQSGANIFRMAPLTSVGCTRRSAMRPAMAAGETVPTGMGASPCARP